MSNGKPDRVEKGFGEGFYSKMSLPSNQSFGSPGEAGPPSGESSTTECLNEKSPISYWRTANANDIEAICNLIDESDHIADELFYQPDVPDLIEKSAFAIVQFNSQDNMISFICAFAYPNVPAVPSFEWFTWIIKAYKVDYVTPRNTFFIHFMAWRSDYYNDFLGITLETIFMEFPFLKNIIIIRPPLVKIPEIMVEYFTPVLPADIDKFKWERNSVQILLLCLRHSLLDRLKIRLAIAEDHDDLMPMIERQTDKLRALYGDFCMSEIVEYPGTEDRKTLVCEVMGYAVAFMTVNRATDLDLLNTQFDLGVFHGLRKPTEHDKSAERLSDDEHNIVYLPREINPSLDLIDSDTMENIFNWKPMICESDEETEQNDKSVESLNINGITASLANLIKDSLNVKINPKFSVYALDQNASNVDRTFYNSEYGEGEESVKTEVSLLSLQYYNLPEYHGPSNAFCIELFAVHEDFDEKLCTDFLEAAFELFPDLEYCLLTIPSQCSVFPLLDLFVRVAPRPLKRFKQELYVCHKSSVMLTFMRVRRIDKSDLDQIYKLLEGITKRNSIYADVVNSCLFSDSAYQGFILICSKSIVGVAVLCNENGMEYLATHYHVEDLIRFELHKIDYHAILKHLVLSPIFQQHARFFLRDIMRMADITSLYRARYEEVQDSYATTSLVTVLGQFVPVKPRRMVKYHEPSLGQNMPPAYLLNYDIPFSLYHINSKICGIRKTSSNINLVVVGASRIAYSFLESLLYGPSSIYVTYNNITWVSPHGTGSELGPHYARDIMFPYRGKYDRRYKAQINLLSFVNFVYGVMTEINRTEKYITINHDAILRYDYLVLLCGKQNLMPVPYFQQCDTRRCNRSRRPRCSLFKYLISQKEKETPEEETIYPSNVFLINTVVDATNTLISLQYMLRKRRNVSIKEKIIIYGYDLAAYLCIQSLLKFGISSQMIVFVEPSPKNHDAEKIFMDPQIDAAVTEILKELQITHYRDYYLYNWTFCAGKQVKTVTFHSKDRKITLKCMAMLPFSEKLVSDVTFKAINEASLVYDGGLIINNRFQTNDPCIYSAGSFTKYQRKYLASDKNHGFYSSNEVGEVLAEIIRSEIDPKKHHKNAADDQELVPELKDPIMTHGQLPGDWNYCRIRKPGKMIPLEAQCNIKEYGDTLITGDCQMTRGYGYFKIHLDDFGFVTSVICFTKDVIDVENLIMLYGKHERYLNNLLMRFDLGMIEDFYSYFRQPWVYALYHDQFMFFMEANKEIFLGEKPAENEMKVTDLIDSTLEESGWEKPSEEELSQIREQFETSNLQEEIAKNLVEYLTTYDEAFPMYATPGVLRVLLRDAETSLLHNPLAREASAPEYKENAKISDFSYRFRQFP